MKDKEIKINLGCGRGCRIHFPDYILVDMIQMDGVDVIADIRDTLPFEDNSADEVVATHILEHCGHYQVQAVLKEIKRILKPGGIVKIAVPNIMLVLDELIEQYKLDKTKVNGVWLATHFFGGQFGETMEESLANGHLTCFDVPILHHQLVQANFDSIDVYYGHADDMKRRHPDTWTKEDPHTDVLATATKPTWGKE